MIGSDVIRVDRGTWKIAPAQVFARVFLDAISPTCSACMWFSADSKRSALRSSYVPILDSGT